MSDAGLPALQASAKPSATSLYLRQKTSADDNCSDQPNCFKFQRGRINLIVSEFISVASVCAPECLENAGRRSFFEAVAIFAPEKLLLYLQGDLVQPFFGAISPIFVILEIGFKSPLFDFRRRGAERKTSERPQGPAAYFLRLCRLPDAAGPMCFAQRCLADRRHLEPQVLR